MLVVSTGGGGVKILPAIPRVWGGGVSRSDGGRATHRSEGRSWWGVYSFVSALLSRLTMAARSARDEARGRGRVSIKLTLDWVIVVAHAVVCIQLSLQTQL